MSDLDLQREMFLAAYAEAAYAQWEEDRCPECGGKRLVTVSYKWRKIKVPLQFGGFNHTDECTLGTLDDELDQTAEAAPA